jgi:maltose-binding protein MalE
MRAVAMVMMTAVAAATGAGAVTLAVTSSSASTTISVEHSGCIGDSGVTRIVTATNECAPQEAAIVWRS